jgi:Exonuclease V - a 5' deoxyribonuclease
MKKGELKLSDVKTRRTFTIPLPRNSRGYEMQLCLYYRILSNMLDGTVDMSRIYVDKGLNSNAVFSDEFLVEVGQLYSVADVLPFDDILENNTLNVRHFFLLTNDRNYSLLYIQS